MAQCNVRGPVRGDNEFGKSKEDTVLERTGSRKTRREVLSVEELVESKPGEHSEATRHHFFNHHVEVEDCAEQHEVPEGDDGGKEAEDGSDPRGVLRVEFADVNKFFVLQLAQRSLPLLIIRVNPAMFLVSQEVFYLLPSKVSLSFLS